MMTKTPKLNQKAVRALCLDIGDETIVQVGNMARWQSYRLYEVLMDACTSAGATRLRQRLEADENLTCEKLEHWASMINKMLDAGVQLPIVEESEVGRD